MHTMSIQRASTKVESLMKESGRIARDMARACSKIRVKAGSTVETLSRIRLRVSAGTHGLVGTFTLDISTNLKSKDSEFTSGRPQELSTAGFGETIRRVGWENTYTQTSLATLVTTATTGQTDWVCLSGPMATSTSGSGKMESGLAMAVLRGQRARCSTLGSSKRTLWTAKVLLFTPAAATSREI